MSQGQEVNLAYSRDVIKDTFDEETLLEFSKSRVSHHVKARSIYTWSDGELSDSTYTENVKLSEQEFPITCDIAIYDDKVRIASLKNRIVGVVIEDKEIAQSLRAIFNLAWKGLSQEKKINKDVLK
jgi:hypothetical protein